MVVKIQREFLCSAMSDSKKRVLLVDDDEEILEVVQLALLDRGYEVLLARDGAEALVRAERDAPDLIVLDVVMVLDSIRKLHFRTPRIIMLTANDEPRHRDFAASRGIDAFLAKPFEIDELLTKVDACLQV